MVDTIVTTEVTKKDRKHEALMHAQTGCDNCKFCGIMNAFDKTVQLVCRRNPPTLTLQIAMTQQGPAWQSATGWPAVQKHEWCGEWAAKEH